MGLFFEMTPTGFMGGVMVLVILILLNEITRRNRWAGIISFVIIPIFMSIFVWPKTAVPGSSVGTWFDWAKLYSVLAGAICFMIIRYNEKAAKNRVMLCLPAIILAINILEAVIRDFECYSINGFSAGMVIVGGPWNIMNGIAGILNIIAISGWFGIYISKNKTKDMIWADQTWMWVIAYDLWNFCYVFNCVPNHSFYAGLILLLSSTVPFIFIQKGAWIQHRANTLAFWMMFVMFLPSFVDNSSFTVNSAYNENVMFFMSFLALVANVALVIYHFYKVKSLKLNPLKDEVYRDTKAYKIVNLENK